MKKFKGRGGPWHYDDELIGVYSESCRFVCDVTDKDNGILIAAAPELLEACMRMRSQLYAAGYEAERGSLNPTKCLLNQIESAINKALGE